MEERRQKVEGVNVKAKINEFKCCIHRQIKTWECSDCYIYIDLNEFLNMTWYSTLRSSYAQSDTERILLLLLTTNQHIKLWANI